MTTPHTAAEILRLAREPVDGKTRALAMKARKLILSGEKGKTIGVALKVDTDRAIRLSHIGHQITYIEASQFTASEILLLRSLAKAHRRNLRREATGSPESGDVSWLAGKSFSWAVSTARKRLGCPGRRSDPKSALSLIDVAGNGYMNLTPLGWMVVQAIETAEIALADQGRQGE